jgi:hypothetical protein
MMEIVPNSFPNKFDAENQKFGFKESKVCGFKEGLGFKDFMTISSSSYSSLL